MQNMEFFTKYTEQLAEMNKELSAAVCNDENYKKLVESKVDLESKQKEILNDIFTYRNFPEKIENLSKVKSIMDSEIKELDKNMKQIEEHHIELYKPKVMNKIYNMIEKPEKSPDGPDCRFCTTQYDNNSKCQFGYFLCVKCNSEYKKASTQEKSVIERFIPHDFDE